MCKFFSFVVTKTGDIFYFNREQRLTFKNTDASPDSHAFICSYYELNEDKVNKYECDTRLYEDNIVFKVNKTLQAKIDYFFHTINLKELVCDSASAFGYCKNIKDDDELRKLITDSYNAYRYCGEVDDDPKVRKYIIESDFAERYCQEIKDRKGVRKYITQSGDAYYYCKYVKDRPEIRKLIISSYYAKEYCKMINDDPEVRKYI